jgi:hypothetical protein
VEEAHRRAYGYKSVNEDSTWEEAVAATPAPPPLPSPPEPIVHFISWKTNDLITEEILSYGPGSLQLHGISGSATELGGTDPWWLFELTVTGKVIRNSAAGSVRVALTAFVIDSRGRELELRTYPTACFHRPRCDLPSYEWTTGDSVYLGQHPLPGMPVAVKLSFTASSCSSDGCLVLPDYFNNDTTIPLLYE